MRKKILINKFNQLKKKKKDSNGKLIINNATKKSFVYVQKSKTMRERKKDAMFIYKKYTVKIG